MQQTSAQPFLLGRAAAVPALTLISRRLASVEHSDMAAGSGQPASKPRRSSSATSASSAAPITGTCTAPPWLHK